MKKYLALLLALAMMLSMMVGCTGSQDDTKPSADTTKPSSGTADTQPSEDTTPAEPQKLTIGIKKQATVEDYDTQWLTKYAEEKLNIDIEFVYFSSTTSEAKTQFGLMVAGNEKLPDIMWGTGFGAATINEYGMDGYILPLDDYLNEEKAPNLFEALTWAGEGVAENLMMFGVCPSDGKTYAFPTLNESTYNGCHYHTFINQKWLDQLNLKAPTTVEELYDVLKAFKATDFNGNGQADEIPAIGSTSYRASLPLFILNAFVYCTDDYFWNVTDGKLWSPWETDEYRQGLIYLNKLVSEGLLDPDTFTITKAGEIIPYSTPSDSPTFCGVIGSHMEISFEPGNERTYEYVPLTPLKGATDKGGYAVIYGHTYSYHTFITTDCENPDLAFKFLDFMASREMTIAQEHGIPGEDWVWDNTGTSAVGNPSTFKQLTPNPWQTQNNKLWNILGPSTYVDLGCSKAWEDDGSWDANRYKQMRTLYQAYMEAPKPAETVTKLLYTEEEQEVVTEYSSTIKSYVKNARAMFATGALDPNDDGDWQEYLNALKAQGIDAYMAAAQSAYTRMNGK